MRLATVIANHGAELLAIADDDGTQLSLPGSRRFGLIVVGDQIEISGSVGRWRIEKRLERQSTLARTDRNGTAKPLAANISRLIVVCAPLPSFDLLLIDQYLVAAAQIGASAVLVINKADLLSGELATQAAEISAIYRALDIPVITCKARHPNSLTELQQVLAGEVSIMVGQSGVGKSTLLSQLLNNPQIRTGALSEQSGLGRHTTTVTAWYPLAGGGAIIDSAGVRQFGLEHLPEADIQRGFSEIQAAAADCRFNNCQHDREPACAVKVAVKTTQIHPSRFANFTELRSRSGS